ELNYINFDAFLESCVLVNKEYILPSKNDLDDISVNTTGPFNPCVERNRDRNISSNTDGYNDSPTKKNSVIWLLANYIINNSTDSIKLFRRVYWPLLLGVYNYNTLDNLTREVQKKRNIYKRDKEEYIIKQTNLNIQKLDPQIFHPLSSDDKNPWTLKQKNQELKEQIKQDILRTYSEKKIFQNEKIRDVLNNILFIWAKKNPNVSYKQGMNEIVAILFIIIYREQVNNDFFNFETKEEQGNEQEQWLNNEEAAEKCNINKYFYKNYCILFDKEEIESDTYILFDHLMNIGMKYLFKSTEEKKAQGSKNLSCKTVLLQKCTYVFHKLLKNSDKQLYNHLISLSIEPQIFLLRWIRLFFCREFQIDDTLILWDSIFAGSYQ
ncbi:GTPase-activating protein, putative, partial [Hepatocystis sp. ex Piliocolobus tephrosceles]